MQIGSNNGAHTSLLLWNGLYGIHDRQPKLVYHRFVFVDNTFLKQFKALVRIIAQPKVHARLIIFQFCAARQYTTE